MQTLSKKKKIIISLAAAITVAVIVLVSVLTWYFAFFTNPYSGTNYNPPLSRQLNETLSQADAKTDLDFLINKLRTKHPAWLEEDKTLRDTVETIYENERQKINGDVRVLQLWQAASKITSALHDAHTNVQYNDYDLYIESLKEIKELGIPEFINGISTKSLYECSKEILSYESEAYGEYLFENTFYAKSKLELFGVDTSNGIDLKFSNGTQKHYSFVEYSQVQGRENSQEAWVSYQIDQTKNIAVFQLRRCNYNAEYKDIVKRFFNEVNAKGIRNIAVDLRGNSGGISSVANEFLSYLAIDSYQSWSGAIRKGNTLIPFEAENVRVTRKENAFDGTLFVMTDVATFSAAMDFTMLVMDNNLGIVVGEAAGNLPDCYIDPLQFSLPKSKLLLTVSFKINHRIDESKKGEPLTPHYECNPKNALNIIYDLIS